MQGGQVTRLDTCVLYDESIWMIDVDMKEIDERSLLGQTLLWSKETNRRRQGGMQDRIQTPQLWTKGSHASVRVGLQTELPRVKNNKAGERRQEDEGID